MKSIGLSIYFCVFILCATYAQNREVKIEQNYQIVELTGPSLLQGIFIRLEWVKGDKLLADNALKDENGKMLEFNSKPEALDYLDSIGWETISSFNTAEFGVKFLLKRKNDKAIPLRSPTRE